MCDNKIKQALLAQLPQLPTFNIDVTVAVVYELNDEIELCKLKITMESMTATIIMHA